MMPSFYNTQMHMRVSLALMLRDKFPTTLELAQDWAGKIEENMFSTKIDPLGSSRISTSKAETKPRTLNTVDPAQDPITVLTQKFEKVTSKLIQTQTALLNKITSLERDRVQQGNFPPRHQQNNHQPRGNQGWNRNRPPPEQRVPNPLTPTNMVNQEEVPWCLPCNKPHNEWDCPQNQGFGNK
jgi:hypothetical protein